MASNSSASCQLAFDFRLSAKCVEMQTFHAEARSSQRRPIFCALHTLRSLRLCVKPLPESPDPAQMAENLIFKLGLYYGNITGLAFTGKSDSA